MASEGSTTSGRRRLHPLTPVFDLITAARQSWLLLILLLRPGTSAIDYLVLPALTLLVAWTILNWLFTSYQLADTDLVFDTGVLQRKNRTVPYDRVQQVDVVQKLRHRILGVARLDVSTAGGGSGHEVRLDVLSVAEARRLQQAIRAVRPAEAPAQEGEVTAATDGTVTASTDAATSTATPPDPSEPDRGRTLLHLGVGDLLLAGVTGARLVVVLGAAFTLWNTIDDLPIPVWDQLDESDVPAITTATIAAAGFTVVLLWFGLAALSSVVTDFDFTIRHRPARFLVSKGLLSRSEVVIPDHRVQTVAFHQSVVRRWLDRTAARVSSAGGHFTIPLVPWATAIDLLGSFVGSPVLPPLLAAPPAALRRAVVRRAVPAAVLAAPIAWFGRPWGAMALVGVPAAALAGWMAWRGMGHGYDDTLLVARRGALYRSFVVVPAAKAQSARVTASVFQRRAGLATLHVDVAAGASASVTDIRTERAHELADALVIPTQARTADDRRSRSDARPRG